MKICYITKFLLASFCILSVNSTAQQGMQGGPHDFTDNDGWNWAGGMCNPCHGTHEGESGADIPLWNRETSSATFTSYSNTTSNTFDATPEAPDGITLLCLSCHDGTLALDHYEIPIYMSGTLKLGTDLSNDHPVSFVYDDKLVAKDKGLHSPTTKASGLGGTIAEDLLVNNKMQCTSCHDIHNSNGYPGLLVMDNTNSELCLTCHDK